ncbi:MAG: hypothetical protein JSU66_16060 [Deltaproteobacteria bacterium]|nr:MAG: hypothetical protein JSU66_16060 [Deltaproteobacteria bacterium]
MYKGVATFNRIRFICVSRVGRAFAFALTAVVLAAPVEARGEPTASGKDEQSFSFEHGYRYTSADGSVEIHAGGVYAGEYVDFDSRNPSDSRARTAIFRAVLEGTMNERLSFRIVPDILGKDTRFNLDEAWLAYAFDPRFKAQAGLIHIPMGFESWFLEQELSLIGYAFPGYIDQRTDLGLGFSGEFGNGGLEWHAAFGFGKGFDIRGDKQEDERISVQAAVFPFLWGRDPDDPEPPEWWQGFFAGLGYSYTDDYEGTLHVDSPLGTSLFNVGRFKADDSGFLHWTVGIDAGPVRIAAERVDGGYSDVELAVGDEDFDDVSSWQASFHWMITGEHYATRAYRQISPRQEFPARPLFGEADEKGFGAVELGVRYSNFDIDRAFFDFGFTSEAQSSQEARTFSAAVNWYPSANFRFGFEYVRIIADDDPGSLGGQGRGNNWVLRGQYQF